MIRGARPYIASLTLASLALCAATWCAVVAKVNGGVNGLLGKAEQLRRSTGDAKGHCVAAAAVEVINSGRGGKKLASWWKS